MPSNSDRTHWTNEIPKLADIYSFGGVPGIEYAYVLPERLYDMQQDGWRQTVGAPAFKLSGPKGDTSFIVVEKGTPALLSPGTTRQKVSVDYDLIERTGLNPADWIDVPVEMVAKAAAKNVPVTKTPPATT